MNSVKKILDKQLLLVEIEIGQFKINMRDYSEKPYGIDYLDNLEKVKHNLKESIKIIDREMKDINILPQ